jgi:hypothetical protein
MFVMLAFQHLVFPILLHDHDEFVYESGFLEGIQVYQHLIKALADTPPF